MLGTEAELFDDLFKIEGRKFDLIIALDVLEHMDDLGPAMDRFGALSHERTKIIISGPTETLLYRFGRWLAGFTGEAHLQNIYDIERKFRERRYNKIVTKNLYVPFVLFKISAWRNLG